jgi:hypothetical protein
MDGDVDVVSGNPSDRTVDEDFIAWFDLVADFCFFPVDGDASLFDETVGLTTGRLA